MRKLRPIMFAGTGSDVGKSVIAAAFCRIFRQDGYDPAPFKAQNMALNSFATPDGLEIGRAQAVQAEAAGVEPSADMNPLLLKPQTDKTCQVVMNGRSIGNRDAYDYFKKEGREELRAVVNAAFDRLAARHNPVVMEGAGSVSEINLRETDLVNMPMAMHAGADVILVADIDRGGVFASVYGSVMLMTPEERRRLKGVLINKFRGDIRLFETGVKMLEDLCGVPVIGVVPYFRDIHVEEEDSLRLAGRATPGKADGRARVAVVLLRHISNFTDFDALERDPRVRMFYTNDPRDLDNADIVIIPGSKTTLSDLRDLRRDGMAEAIVKARRDGKTILGICGGYQMMGLGVADPGGLESGIEELPGLSLLPTRTVMSGEKLTRQVRFGIAGDDARDMEGYEIHNGETSVEDGGKPSPLCVKANGEPDGYMADEKCMGTYIHGILDNPRFVDFLLRPYAEKTGERRGLEDYKAFKEEQYDKLADHVRASVDMRLVYDILSADDDD